MTLTLISLSCPACGASLQSGPQRRVFVCGCGTSSSPRPLVEGSLRPPVLEIVERSIAWPADTLPSRGSIVLLPVWVVPVHTESLGNWSANLPSEVRVPAVGVDRMELLLRTARNLTRAGRSWRAVSGVGAPHPPAELTLEDAYAVAEPIALGRVEGWPPDPLIDEVEVPMGTPRLVDTPCHWSGSQLVDLAWGISIPPPLVEPEDLPDHRGLFVALSASLD